MVLIFTWVQVHIGFLFALWMASICLLVALRSTSKWDVWFWLILMGGNLVLVPLWTKQYGWW